MRPEIEIPRKIKTHLEAQDVFLDKMIADNFEHESIHEYREAIRRLRAMLYFYRPYLSTSDFLRLEELSRHNFDQTSLIREIDVFENGYGSYMKPEVKEKLDLLKTPLLNRLMTASNSMKTFQFGSIEIRLKCADEDIPYEVWEKERHNQIVDDFIGMNIEPLPDELERYVHIKRSLVKKILYVHHILMSGKKDLNIVDASLDAFQDAAKRLHDTCVNLRFIGQYELDDPALLEKLIIDHNAFLIEADDKYEKACALLKEYIVEAEA